MKKELWFALGLTVFVLLFLYALTLSAATPRPFRFMILDLCTGYTISKRGSDVLVRCPGDAQNAPWFTFTGCAARGDPDITQRSASGFTIACKFG